MRHRVAVKKLNRPSQHRKLLLRNLVSSVIQYEYIDTTDAKAKALLPLLDKCINIAKKKDLNARRRLNQELTNELAIRKLLEVLADRFQERTSGFASLVKLGKRKGDAAEIIRVSLLEK